MKKTHLLLFFLTFLLQGYNAEGQDIDFNLRYNGTAEVYEVYALPDFSSTSYFVGGGSQLSLVIPESIANNPISITAVNGGFWFDNSQIYAPTVDPAHDFHGIATNGAFITFVQGEEIILFTFTIPGSDCTEGFRLFENASDPTSSDPGMGGGDFQNFFADVFNPFTNNWNANYYNGIAICPQPPNVFPNPLVIPQDSTGMICMPIMDANPTDTFTEVTCAEGPSEGTATATIDGNSLCVEYTPDAGYTGTDSICVIVCDVSGLCDTVSVPVTVVPELPPSVDPEPPVVIATPLTVPQDSTGSLCTVILDPNSGDTFTSNLCVGSPDNGAATTSVNGNQLCVEYTPDAGYNGDDEICVIVCDQTNLCDTITIPVNVIPVIEPVDSIQPPTLIVPSIVSPEEETPVVCGDIIDPNTDDTHTITICEQPANGTAAAVVDNATDEVCITLTPNPGFTGTDSLCLIVCDQTNLCDTINVPIEILPVNDPPLAVNDINITQVGEDVVGNVLTNDEDPEGDSLIVNTTPLNVMNGIATIDEEGNYTFTPDPGFEGTGSFEYIVCDDGSPVECDTALVEIEVIDNSAVDNNEPVGVSDNFVTEEGAPFTASVLSNDTDPDGDDLTITVTPVTDVTNGDLTINPDGTIEYTPDNDFTGTETFEYEVCDNGSPVLCDTVSVTIEVLPDDGENDLYATDDANSGEEGATQSGNVVDNDNDPENGTLMVTTTPLSGPDNGSLTLNSDGTYDFVPDAGFTGNDQFVYQVCDDGSPVACDSATVYLVVLEAQNAPIVYPNPLTIPQDSTGSVCMPILDLDEGDTFTANLCPGTPVNGTATPTVSNGELCLEYTPTTEYAGVDSICVVVCDQTNRCDTVLVPVTIIAPIPTVSEPEPPIVIITPIVVPQDSTTEVCTVILDPNDGDIFTAMLCTGSPENGVASPTVAGNNLCVGYTPNGGYNGDDEVCVIVCDQDNNCDTITIPVTVVPIPGPETAPQPPVAIVPPIVTTTGIPTSACGPIVDPNTDDTHFATICEQPANGIATVAVNNADNTLCVDFEPNATFSGTDSICVIVCDQTNLCDTIQIAIEVLATNDAPLAVNDINVTSENMDATGSVLPNDSDPNGDDLSVNITPLNETNGTATIDAAGNYTFTPDPGFIGEATFEYVLCDDGSPVLCDTAMVVITVLDDAYPDNAPVIGVEDNFTTEDTNPLTGDLLANDSDPDGDNITITTTPVTDAMNGTLVINPDGTFSYDPDPDFTGTDSFEYRVCDDGTPMTCDTVLVTIEVLPDDNANDLFATDDANTGYTGQDQTGNVLSNDNDPEGDDLIASTTPVTDVANGTLTLGVDGTYTYTPDNGFVGNDQFSYQVCDDGSPVVCDTAVVYLSVLLGAQPPLVISNPLTIPTDSTGTVCMPITDPNEGDTFTANLCPGTPTNGSATPTVTDGELCVEYTPDLGYAGTDSICVIVCDQTNLCDTVMVPVTVIEPLPPSTNPEPPIVIVTPIVVPQDSTTEVCTVILDPNAGDTFTANPCPGSTPAGTATTAINGNELCIEYTGAPGFTGEDEICLIICDQTNLCDTITVPVTVIETPNPADTLQPPALVFPPIETEEETPITVCGSIIDANVNDTHMVTICGGPDNGTAIPTVDNASNTLCIEYEPDTDFFGSDSICVIVCDQTNLCDTLMVPVEVLPSSDVPVIENFASAGTASVTFDENSTDVVVDYDATDGDGEEEGTGDNDQLDWSITGGTDATAFTIDDNGNLIFVNPPDYEDQSIYEVEITVTDSNGETDVQLLTITINNVIEYTHLELKVMLQGAMIQNGGNDYMRADLTLEGYVPTFQPYNSNLSSRFTHVDGGTESTTPLILAANGGTSDAIVDWVFVELRDATDSTSIIRTVSALVKADGDIVAAADGDSLLIPELPDEFYVAVKHRNHLGAMTKTPIAKVAGKVAVDFTTIDDADLYTKPGYETLAMNTINGKRVLWAGNANADGKVKYDSGLNDRLIINFNVLSHPGNSGNILNFSNASGYYQGDVNLDGTTKYDGFNNDRVLLQNIVLLYPLNTSFLNNFDGFIEQMP